MVMMMSSTPYMQRRIIVGVPLVSEAGPPIVPDATGDWSMREQLGKESLRINRRS